MGVLMSSFFDRFKGKREPTSAEIAKERLQLVLVSDRSHLSPDKLEAMQTDILMVIKRYIQIDDLDVQIKFEQRDRKHYLVADIPLHREHVYGDNEDEFSALAPDEAPDEAAMGLDMELDTGPGTESGAEPDPESDAEPESD